MHQFKLLSDPEILMQAYMALRSNPGNMVPGTDEITLENKN